MYGIIFKLFQLYREYLTFPYSNLDYISGASLGDVYSYVGCAFFKEMLSKTSINDNGLPARQRKTNLLHKLSLVGQNCKVRATDIDIPSDICAIYPRSQHSFVVSEISE